MRPLVSSCAIATAIVGLAVAVGSAQGPAPARGIQPYTEHPILAIGSPAPDFALPGVDGRVHRLSEYAGAKVLAIVFECNHCPTSQLYEGRIEKLYADYRSRGLTIVAINPNNPKSVRYDELGYTDLSDSLAEMRVRSQFRHFQWPYLYDGDTQAVANKFGVVATPHIFLFDQAQKLAYQGRIDDNQREDLVKTQDARTAIDAMLAGKPVPVATTRAFGCTTKWLEKSSDVRDELAKIQGTPVSLNAATVADIKTLRANATDKPTLVYVWSASQPLATSQFPDLMATYWMYHKERGFNLETIDTDAAGGHAAALAALTHAYLAGPNLQFTGTHEELQTALGVPFRPDQPLTLVIGPGGKLLYQRAGKLDIVQARRIILVNLPDTSGYIGQEAYWTAAVNAQARSGGGRSN